MIYNDVLNRLAELYLFIQTMLFLHPLRSDAVIIAAVFMLTAFLLRRNRRRRLKIIRLLWGTYMRRRDRVRYHMKLFEDAIVETAMEAVHRGNMSEAEEKIYFEFFADKCGMDGFRPAVNVKYGIRARLKRLYKTKPRIPGDPLVIKRDTTYEVSPEVEGLLKSRYLQPPVGGLRG